MAKTGREHPRMAISFVVGFRHQLARGRACMLHAHEDWELVFHPTGRGTTTVGSTTWSFVPGDLFAYPPRTAHDQVMSEAGEDWCLQVRGFVPPVGLRHAAWHARLSDDAATTAEIAWLTSGFAEAAPQLAHLRVATVVAAAIGAVHAASDSTASDPAHDLAVRAQRLSRERGHQLAGVRELAAELGVSPDWLRHACARAGLGSPLSLLTSARLARAKALLTHTRQPLAEIAAQCGYRDARYLVAVFRRELGCTPGQLRAGYRPPT
jgi:AraC-like DNA-binding protein